MELEPASLERWLGTLGRETPETAAAELDEAMEHLGDAGLVPATTVPLLECLRAALPAQVARLAKAGYADRPLPLAPAERAVLAAVQGLFGKLSDLYWLCLQQFEREPASAARDQNLAACLQRCVHALVSRMIEDYRARQVIEAAVWFSLHNMLDKAQALGLDRVTLPDPLNPNGTSAISNTYGRAVLLASAQAGAMTPRNLDATLALTGLLEPFVDCTWQAADQVAESRVESTGRLRVLKAAGATHVLNNTRLAGALLACSQKLAAGEEVASLDVLPLSRSEIGGLLARLHRVWCGTGDIRSEARARSEESATVAAGFYAIYRLVTGAELTVPHEFHVYATGTRPGEGAPQRRAELAGSGDVAPWRILDRSGEGLRAARSAAGGRLSKGFLMGLRVTAAGHRDEISLGEVRWVQEDAASSAPSISAGIKRLPGEVIAVIMRGLGGRDGSQFQEVTPVFLLEQAAAPKLIVPSGWWKEDRVVDLWRKNAISRLRMGELMIRGTDFEAGRFVVEKPQRH